MCYKLIINVGTCNVKHVNTVGLPYHALRFPNKIVKVIKRMSCGSMKLNTYLDLAIKIIMRGVRTISRLQKAKPVCSLTFIIIISVADTEFRY